MIPVDRPDFAIVYLGTIDTIGHWHGWMSHEYLKQVSRVDRWVGILLDSLPAGCAVIVNSDHGGHDRSHGTDLPEDDGKWVTFWYESHEEKKRVYRRLEAGEYYRAFD